MDMKKMPQIQELTKQISDKIAAGEVVDRPLSIVKELLENAIDAEATSITVEIKNGGKTYIRVTDDGCGIEKEQVTLAFQRHATSKIVCAEDLERINTLGFRGEALASIAAVSKVELITKPSIRKTGTKVSIQGGGFMEQTETGCPDGTTLIVTDLFYNTPARFKFLKSDNTESSLIIDFVSKMALAYSKIHMRLINNGNILFSTNGKGDVYSNILTIFSKETGQKLLYLEEDNGVMLLEGYVSEPSFSKTNRKSQILFVNGRYIQSKLLDRAIVSAYEGKLFEGRYPSAYLFLYVKPETIDVNIHPNKKEIRFDDEETVFQFVRKTLRQRLDTEQAIPQIRSEDLFRKTSFKEITPPIQQQEEIKTPKKNILEKEKKLPSKEQEMDLKNRLKSMRAELQTQGSVPDSVEEEKTIYFSEEKQELLFEKKGIRSFDISALKVIGAIFNTYIMASDGDFFYLIDQHAAHERIFYEKLMGEFQNEKKHAQLILTPIVKEVTPAIRVLSDQWLNCLKSLGFSIEEFGSKSFVIKEIPLLMTQEEACDFLDYFFDNISDSFHVEDQKRIDKIIMQSCKNAVKAHDVLSVKEMEALLSQLSETEQPFSCPHGRPTFVKLSKYEIEKMFKRV